MTTPSFTASASLSPTTGHYAFGPSHHAFASSGPASTAGTVQPAAIMDWVKCGLASAGAVLGCSGPQAATGACAVGGAVAAAECSKPVSDLASGIWDTVTDWF